MPIGVTRDCETVVLDSYNPPVSLRMSVEEAARLRDSIESAIMDYDARLENIEQPAESYRNISGCCEHGVPYGQSCRQCDRIVHFDPMA